MSNSTVYDMILNRLKMFKRCDCPYEFVPYTTSKKRKSEGDLKSSDIHSTGSPTFEDFCRVYKYKPLLFEETMCIQAAVVVNLEMKRYLKNLRDRSVIKVSKLIGGPCVFENYIPPPPSLFAENEIILFDDDSGNAE